MNVFIISISIFFSFISTAIMAYISMATGIGPWIDSTLAIISIIVVNIFYKNITSVKKTELLSLPVIAGSIGGILATGIGFSFPAIFFTNPEIFNSWLNNTLEFMLIVSSIAICAGAFGLLIANIFSKKLLDEFDFPIGELVYKIINNQNQKTKTLPLIFGFITTQIFLIIQSSINFLSKNILLIPSLKFSIFQIPKIKLSLDIAPLFLAVGFITGHVIAIPLLVGLLIKIFLIDPFFLLYAQQHFNWIPSLTLGLSDQDFAISLCSGMVLYGALSGIFNFLNSIIKYFKNIAHRDLTNYAQVKLNIKYLLLILPIMLILSYLKFSLLEQIFILSVTFICIYQMLLIAGQIGIAPLGRFATYAMIPFVYFFTSSPIKAIMLATFVEVSGGVACSALFSKKLALLGKLNKNKTNKYLWLGVVTSAAFSGIIFWLLISHFKLGTLEGLSVNRAAGRALLLNISKFDYYCISIGILISYILKKIKINSALALGGILMQPNLSILLIISGLAAKLVNDKERLNSFSSGVFACNSLFMIVKAFIQSIKG